MRLRYKLILLVLLMVFAASQNDPNLTFWINAFSLFWIGNLLWRKARTYEKSTNPSGRLKYWLLCLFIGLAVIPVFAVQAYSRTDPGLNRLNGSYDTLLAILVIGWIAYCWQHLRRSQSAVLLQTEQLRQSLEVVNEPDRLKSSETDNLSDPKKLTLSSDRKETNIRITGKGAQSSAVFELSRARYRIQYSFPKEESVIVDLIDVENVDAEEKRLLWEPGNGSTTFVIQKNGRYIFQVNPVMDMKNEISWDLELEKVT